MENCEQSSPRAREEEEDEAKRGGGEGGGEEDEKIIQFLDSMDSYLTLMDSLSSTLRQGWLELASARHSMGSSRISSALLSHKVQSAATTMQVAESNDKSVTELQTHFTLSKWAYLREGKYSGEAEAGGFQNKSSGSQLRHRGPNNFAEGCKESYSTINGSPIASDGNIQRERSKSLSVFGTLVPPKLRAAQVSFETALDSIVELANMRSMVLSSLSQLQQEMESSS
ncbi:coiled-coil domain-containing protein 115 [Phoenix dactylifera]|uniref:Vacuolar ATPase assembly protein VMA22 n=1 Tax=Phoenix dactylifera TaxID=42345 RepID=A0A8B8ZSV6_PHODC|nr:coiled-coil domain-containing protein 115 [Phoenix dactylifera]